MNDLELEKAMAAFLDDDQCEKTSEAIYQLIRASFTAGWKAGKRAREDVVREFPVK